MYTPDVGKDQHSFTTFSLASAFPWFHCLPQATSALKYNLKSGMRHVLKLLFQNKHFLWFQAWTKWFRLTSRKIFALETILFIKRKGKICPNEFLQAHTLGKSHPSLSALSPKAQKLLLQGKPLHFIVYSTNSWLIWITIIIHVNIRHQILEVSPEHEAFTFAVGVLIILCVD